MKSALLIEDDENLIELVRVPLEELGLALTHAGDGRSGLEMATAESYELIVLDMRLPELEGIEVCKGIREKNKKVPIIMLTSVGDEINKVLLLELGADDYITKPFSVLEFKARCKAALRRAGGPADVDESEDEIIYADDIKLDLTKRKVRIDDQEVELTAREFDLLAILAKHPGRPFSRNQLNEHLYGFAVSGYDQSISSHVNRIRSKIEEDPRNPRYLLTVHGVGYKFRDREN